MILEFVDHSFYPPLSEKLPQLELDNRLGDQADGEKHGLTPKMISTELKIRPARLSGQTSL